MHHDVSMATDGEEAESGWATESNLILGLAD